MIELRNVAHYVSDKIDVSSLKAEEYVSTDNMLPNRGGISSGVSLPEATRVTKYKPGDVLVSNIRPYFKKIWFANRESGCSNDVIVFRTNEGNWNNKFLYYVLSQDSFFDFMMAGANGTKMPRGNKKTIPQFLVPNYDIEKQNKIVSILSAYDELIENNKKQIKLLEEVAQRLYKEWFIDLHFPGHESTQIIDGLPTGWKNGTLGDIASDVGLNEKKENRGRYAYYLPIDCLPRKSLVYTNMEDINLAESSLVSFKPNDILFGAMRPYFHKVVIARDDGLTRSTCFVINTKNSSYWAYLTMLLFSEDTVNYATRISVGTTMPYTRWKDFIKMPIVIPTTNVVVAFGKQFSPISNKISSLAEQNILLTQARDRLLPKLMNGEIEV